MKAGRHRPSTSNKLTSVSEFTSKKGQVNLPSLPKAKRRRSAKLVHTNVEPMVLRSPPTGESILRHALPILSSKTVDLLGDEEIIRNAAKHLEKVVSTLEEAYGFDLEDGEKSVVKKLEQEDRPLSVGDGVKAFLVYCSQGATQLEETVKEEQNWFQRQVNQVEEMGKDQSLLEEDLPVPVLDKTVTITIAQVVRLLQNLEQLRNHFQAESGYSRKAICSKSIDEENQPKSVASCENVDLKIKEFIRKHPIEESRDISAKIASSMTCRFNLMLKIFEKQANELERVMNDQGVLEAKYKQMQSDFESLSEKKLALENELQKLKDSEKTKKTGKTEKKKDKRKIEDSEEKMSVAQQLKMRENLLQVQKVADDLKTENKALREQLTQALLEGEKAKYQLDYVLSQGMEFRDRKPSLEIPSVQNRRPITESFKKKRSSPAISDLSQILKSEEKSAVERSSELSVEKDLGQTSAAKTGDGPLATGSSSKKNQDLLSVENLPQGKETTTSLPPPVLMEGDSKADVSKEKLQRKIENQTDTEARELEATFEVSYENENIEILDKDSAPSAPIQNMEENISRMEGYKEVSETPVSSEDATLVLIAKSENEKLEDTRNENSHGDSLEHQESMSKTKLQERKQDTSTGGRRPSDSLDHQESVSKTKLQERKQDTSTGGRRPSDSLILDHQESVSKTKLQKKKQDTSRRERLTGDSLILDHQESVSKTKLQEKKQDTSRRERLTSDSLVLEHQESVSKTELQEKKQDTSSREIFTIYNKFSGDNLLLDHQESVSKTKLQEKKQDTSTGGRLTDSDEKPDENVVLEHQDFTSKSEMQFEKERTIKREDLTTQEEESGKSLMSEHQNSATEFETTVKKQKTSKQGRHSISPKKHSLVNQESMSKLKMQVKKQAASESRRHSTFPVEAQKKDMSPENLLSEERVLLSRVQSQTEKLQAISNDNLSNQKVAQMTDEHLLPIDSRSKDHVQIKTQKSSQEEMLDQDMHEGPKSAVKHVDEIQTSKADDIQRLTNYKATTELPGTSESHPELHPSISDIILHLGLDKVIENDISQLTVAAEGGKIKSEFKTQLKSVPDSDIGLTSAKDIKKGPVEMQLKGKPETDKDHLANATGKGALKEPMKIQLEGYPETDIGNLTNTFKGSKNLNGIKMQPSSHPETDTESLGDISAESVLKEPVKKELRRYSETDTKPLADISAKSVRKEPVKKQLMSYPETDTEHLRNTLKGNENVSGVKIQPKSHPATITDPLADVSAKAVLKEPVRKDLRRYPETDTKHLVDVSGKTVPKEPVKKQLLGYPDTDMEHLANSSKGTNVISGMKMHPKSHPETNGKPLAHVSGKSQLKDPVRKELMSYPETDTVPLADFSAKSVFKEPVRKELRRYPETDAEHLANASEGTNVISGMKMHPKGHPETDTKPLAHVSGKSELKDPMKKELTSYPETDIEHLRSTLKGSENLSGMKIQPKHHLEIATEHLSDVSAKTVLKEPVRKEVRRYPETDAEHLANASEGTNVISGMKMHPKGHPETDTKSLAHVSGRNVPEEPMKKKLMSYPETDFEHQINTLKGNENLSGVKIQPKSHPETDMEHLSNTFKGSKIVSGLKTHPKSHLETNTKPLADAIGNTVIKQPMRKELTRSPETDMEHFTNVFKGSKVISRMKTEPKSHPGTGVEHLKTAVKGEIQGPDKVQLKIQPGINTELFIGAFGKNVTIKPVKTQLKRYSVTEDEKSKISALGDFMSGVNLLKNKAVPTQHIEGTYYTRKARPTHYETKVITLSPFATKEKDKEESLTKVVPKLPKAIHRTSKTGSNLPKSVLFPFMNKQPSGLPKTKITSQKSVELPYSMAAVQFTTKTPAYKVLNTAERKLVQLPYSKK